MSATLVPDKLSDLTDVDGDATPTNGHALMGDGSKFQNRAITQGDVADLTSALNALAAAIVTAQGTADGAAASAAAAISSLASKLSLSGGTLTGALNGTHANFSQDVAVGSTLTSATVYGDQHFTLTADIGATINVDPGGYGFGYIDVVDGASGTVLSYSNGDFTFANTVTANAFQGNGAAINSLNASSITDGTIANARTSATNAAVANTICLRGSNSETTFNYLSLITDLYGPNAGYMITAALGMSLANNRVINWSSTNQRHGTPDVGLGRDSAGVVKVTNGSTGYGSCVLGSVILKATVPATSTSAGVQGEVRCDGSYAYFCTATNAWKRVALTTF